MPTSSGAAALADADASDLFQGAAFAGSGSGGSGGGGRGDDGIGRNTGGAPLVSIHKRADLLLRADDMPEWYWRTPFIDSGYRDPAAHSTVRACLVSALRWHNETLNIHTHLWPAVGCFALIIARQTMPDYVNSSAEGKWANIVTNVFTGIMCLCSAWAHTVHLMSAQQSRDAWIVDNVGIIIGSFGRLFPDLWLLAVLVGSRTCFQVTSGVSAAFGAICIWRALKNDWNWVGPFFVYSMVPYNIAIAAIVFGTPNWLYSQGVDVALARFVASCSVGCSVFCLVAAFCFFKGRLPERYWNPNGRLDFVGNSHQIFHLGIVAGFSTGFAAMPSFQALERCRGFS
jgi:adiponectin receptor